MENNQPVIPPQQPVVESVQQQQVQVQPARQTFYKNKKIIIIVIGIILLIIAIFAGVLIFAQKPKPKTYTLTQQNLGGVIHIKKGDEVVISRKTVGGLQLKTQLSNPSTISKAAETYSKDGSFIGKFVGNSSGSTNLLITGSLNCSKGYTCFPFQLVIYKTTIVVDK